MKNISQAFRLALKNIRSRIFHTFLSVLGIIIGVGALVSMLSLIEGLEVFAKQQIESTTGLNAVIVSSPTYNKVNNVRIQKDSITVMDFDDVTEMAKSLTLMKGYTMAGSWASTVSFSDSVYGAYISMMAEYRNVDVSEKAKQDGMISGNNIDIADSYARNKVAVINEKLVKLMIDSTGTNDSAIGKEITIDGETYKVIGVEEKQGVNTPSVRLPAGLFSKKYLADKNPRLFLMAKDVEKLKDLQNEIKNWFKENRKQLHKDIKVEINEFRMDQLEQGFLIFRIIMGLIVGISVIVGGVGIMNVMLITVKERTPEIGIRKAIGAKRGNILWQFLTESVVISLLGSILGVLFGIVFTSLAVPIVNELANEITEELPLRAVYTMRTMATIGVIAILIGILFGTYPALRASKLNPVDAINRV